MCIFKHSGKSKDETIVKKTVMCSDVFRFNYYNFPAKFDEIFLVAVTERSIVPPLVLEEKNIVFMEQVSCFVRPGNTGIV